jgi:SulP family sulfate permease
MSESAATPQPSAANLFGWLIEDLKPKNLLPILTAALVIGVMDMFLVISFAAVIFSGPLKGQVGLGIGIFLVNTALMYMLLGLFSSTPGQMLSIQDSPTAIFAVIAVSLVALMPAGSTPLETALTVIGAMMLGTFMTGVFFLALGVFRLGGLIRFVPYSVTGGFLAGTGWLLLVGGIGLAIDLPSGFSAFSTFVQPAGLVRWLPALLFGIALLLITRRFKHFMIAPALLIGFMLAFYIGLLAAGIRLPDAIHQGFMLGPFAAGSSLWRPVALEVLQKVHWPLLAGQIANFGSIMFVSAVSHLLYTGGVELATEQETDASHDLKLIGGLNILSAALGGGVSYLALSMTTLAHRMNASRRLTSILAGGLFLIPVLVGPALLTLFPRMVLGGVLIYLGLGFLVEWVYDAYFSMHREDYFVVLLILITIAAVGFLPGVAVGILAAVALFVVNYSRINVIKHSLTLTHRQSNFDRPLVQREMLTLKGDQAVILELQGYIFFGTADQLVARVRQRLTGPAQEKMKFLLLDFRLVTGVDSSAVVSFSRLHQFARKEKFVLIFSGLPEQALRKLASGGFATDTTSTFNIFTDMDRALEWIENRILYLDQATLASVRMSMDEHLRNIFEDRVDVKTLKKYFKRQDVQVDEVIVSQADKASTLFFVESGQLRVELETGEGKHIRLKTIGAGSLVGEIGLYTGAERSASIIAEKPSVLYTLSGEALAQMEKKDPKIAIEFHKFVAVMNSQRLTDSNRAIETLMG